MKYLLAVALLFVCGTAEAGIDIGELIDKAPEINTGIAYSIMDSQIKPIATVKVYEYKGVNFEVGATTDEESLRLKEFSTVVGQVSYTIAKAGKLTSIPILKELELTPGAFVGFDRVAFEDGGEAQNEFDWGFSFRLLGVKF